MDKDQQTRVLVLIDWYLPGYKAGGPIQSVTNLVASLRDKINFSIITRNSDFGDDTSYPNITSDQWIEAAENVRIYYLSESNQNLKGLRKVIDPDDYDFLYLNSVFSYKFTILPLMAFKASKLKIILAPRGMLGKGAMEIKSFKKKLFLKAAHIPGLYDNLLWQATNELERSEILEVFGKKSRVEIASNIPSLVPAHNPVREKKSGDLKLVYLSRISEKKDTLGLLKLLKGLNVEGNITLHLYGPIEDEKYWAKCEKSITSLPSNIQITYQGAIQQNKIQEVLSKYHVFTLMTKHENFGHAIFEALAAGCPLLISNTTPWRNLEELSIGWDLSSDDGERFESAISTFLSMGQEEYSKMSMQAHHYAQNYLQGDSAVAQSLNLFKD